MRIVFSEALSLQSRKIEDMKIRPMTIMRKALDKNDTLGVGDLPGDEEILEEGRVITGQKAIYQPTKEEWDEHMRAHIPFIKWCAFCVKGKCRAGAHRRVKKSEEDKDNEIPVISLD